MKKIIKGKLYDTDTAQLIGGYCNGYPTNDFKYLSEDLYRKKTGEFFLHGEGGALSSYASHEGDMRGYGECITPLTYDEAASWAESHLDADDYISVFGAPAEDDTTTALHIEISSASYQRLRQLAAKNGQSLREAVESLI